ncbi:CBS domain-containing protein [bacterium]|nr:CBS domain-containing protein [bacterium]
MKIHEILKDKGHQVYTIGLESTVCEVIHMFLDKRVGALIVTAADESIAGIVTEKDVIRCYPDTDPLLDKPVSAIMTPADKLLIASPDDTVQYAMSIMTHQRIKHIPVMKNKTLVGIISIGDAVKSLLEQSQLETKRLQDYIAGTYPEE